MYPYVYSKTVVCKRCNQLDGSKKWSILYSILTKVGVAVVAKGEVVVEKEAAPVSRKPFEGVVICAPSEATGQRKSPKRRGKSRCSRRRQRDGRGPTSPSRRGRNHRHRHPKGAVQIGGGKEKGENKR
ncbi:uncharacterized protein LOC126847679 [Adelges cooleyi]|uniref:uncharacterized protein LOC126847679 n=1 Tax=Adelges cooleyi TaxID=133065 RepID=UPI0021801C25|nr:uncharacterized protein LOC126847679 [Adelges cooleyi]